MLHLGDSNANFLPATMLEEEKIAGQQAEDLLKFTKCSCEDSEIAMILQITDLIIKREI